MTTMLRAVDGPAFATTISHATDSPATTGSVTSRLDNDRFAEVRTGGSTDATLVDASGSCVSLLAVAVLTMVASA